MSFERENEEKALAVLAACYMNELVDALLSPVGREAEARGMAQLQPLFESLTYLTADGESLVDAILEQIYAEPLGKNTAILRALNIGREEIKDSRRQEVGPDRGGIPAARRVRR